MEKNSTSKFLEGDTLTRNIPSRGRGKSLSLRMKENPESNIFMSYAQGCQFIGKPQNEGIHSDISRQLDEIIGNVYSNQTFRNAYTFDSTRISDPQQTRENTNTKKTKKSSNQTRESTIRRLEKSFANQSLDPSCIEEQPLHNIDCNIEDNCPLKNSYDSQFPPLSK